MLSYIEKLRKAPMAQRRRVAALATIVVVGVVALIWIVWLSFNLASVFDTKTDKVTPQNSGIQAPY